MTLRPKLHLLLEDLVDKSHLDHTQLDQETNKIESRLKGKSFLELMHLFDENNDKGPYGVAWRHRIREQFIREIDNIMYEQITQKEQQDLVTLLKTWKEHAHDTHRRFQPPHFAALAMIALALRLLEGQEAEVDTA